MVSIFKKICPSDRVGICAIVSINDPSPIAFLNVFESEDVWVKVKGCDACPVENRISCCGNCPFIMSTGECKLHLEPNGSQKPFYCLIHPNPKITKSTCFLEWKCLQGSRIGQIHRQRDHSDVFLEGE